MSKRTRTIRMDVCENPECGNETPAEQGWGYFIGRGHFMDAGIGGPISKTYACSLDCIAPAIAASIDRMMGPPDRQAPAESR
jgi:hypothetical protein